MKFVRVFSPEGAKKIYKSYSNTFPPDERRGETDFENLFSNANVKVFSIQDNLHQEVGYAVCWYLEDFIFIEHMEIFSPFRGMKYGSKILSQLSEKYHKIALETEPDFPHKDNERRIAFYKKNGFQIIDQAYIQPAYEAEKKEQNLWLLANWIPENILKVKEQIYRIVYGVEV